MRMNNALPSVIDGLYQYIVEQDDKHIKLKIPNGIIEFDVQLIAKYYPNTTITWTRGSIFCVVDLIL